MNLITLNSMKNLIKITLFEPLTQGKIDSLISSDDQVIVQVERNYPCGDVPELLSLLVPERYRDWETDRKSVV